MGDIIRWATALVGDNIIAPTKLSPTKNCRPPNCRPPKTPVAHPIVGDRFRRPTLGASLYLLLLVPPQRRLYNSLTSLDYGGSSKILERSTPQHIIFTNLQHTTPTTHPNTYPNPPQTTPAPHTEDADHGAFDIPLGMDFEIKST